jgi:hypothetical protein
MPREVREGEKSESLFVIKRIKVEETILPDVENTANFHLVLDENESSVRSKCTTSILEFLFLTKVLIRPGELQKRDNFYS